MQQNSCPIEGSLRDGKFHFTYRSRPLKARAGLRLVRHGRFAGQWRPKGSSTWSSWRGEREFEGIWETSFGLLRLVQEPEHVLGVYEMKGPDPVRWKGN
jgi:hypothetical protein